MKAIVLMFDSLNRHYLAPYGCSWTQTPNFRRLAERTVCFDNAYVGSMPCMPARRELHTGRYNFLHRGWGGLEPFDDSMPQLLSESGVSTHACTDHYHYWEDGGHHYLQRYDTYQGFRGQEGDPWRGQVRPPTLPRTMPGRGQGRMERQDEVNRQFFQREEDWPMHQTVTAGLEFLERNHDADRWFLHIETFDPHEPFCAPPRYRDLYPHDFAEERCDWPPYGRVAAHGVTPAQIRQMRAEYAALLSFCDAQLGRVLDAMDRHDLWRDTLLIVNTDHGFLLGEHEVMAKVVVPFYNEVARIPLFIWDPRSARAGERRQALVQTIDLPATLLEFFGVSPTPDMQGRPLAATIAQDTPVRSAGLFGCHGKHLNLVTADGLVYMRSPEDPNALFPCYSLDFTTMRGWIGADDLRRLEWTGPLSFTKGMRVTRWTGRGWTSPGGVTPVTQVFDLNRDPSQEHPFRDPGLEARLETILRDLLRASDAPPELAGLYGLA